MCVHSFLSLLCGRWRTLCGWASERSMRTLHVNPPHIVDGRARCHTSYNMRARLPHSRFARERYTVRSLHQLVETSQAATVCALATHTHTLNRSTIAGSRQAWFVPDCISRSLRVCRREYSRRAHGRRAERERESRGTASENGVGESKNSLGECSRRAHLENTLSQNILFLEHTRRTRSRRIRSQNTLSKNTLGEYTFCLSQPTVEQPAGDCVCGTARLSLGLC